MDARRIKWILGAVVTVTALTTYVLTLQPSVPFWDCGEFSAAIALQQVPHPPGAPLFLMVGKLFHLLPFGDPGWRMNLISAVATAGAALVLYLLLSLVLEHIWRAPRETLFQALALYGSALVGALALTFSDTVWFNAVESEVYAASLLFVALVLYLAFLWYVRAEEPQRALPPDGGVPGWALHRRPPPEHPDVNGVMYLVVFRRYMPSPLLPGSDSRRGRSGCSWGPAAGFLTVYWGITPMAARTAGRGFPLKNAAREHLIEDSPVLTILTLLGLGGLVWWLVQAYRKQRHTEALALSALLAMVLGFTTYAHVIIRANAHPPMNENEPTDLKTLISYLGREQYGEAPWWPRRYRFDDPYYTRNYSKYGAWYPPRMKAVERRDGSLTRVPEWTVINTSGELSYLWNYQVYHMYLRYLFWNYVGRLSDVQDAPATLVGSKRDALLYNYDSGYAHLFPVRFFGLPLLLGLFGLVGHFSRDRRTAWVMLVSFLLMGVLAAIAQNQQEPQPRERDYFYVGSFFVFCFWIGIGTYELVALLRKRLDEAPAAIAGVGIPLVAVPVNMAVQGWSIHDRSLNYLPFDHSYNILQSCEPNAILFTNGDNDTFPLWYLQDVAGVRRDVRVVNLSLGNTLWYIRQLKHREPHGAQRIPLSFPDEALASEDSPRALAPELGDARPIAIPVRREILERFTRDSALLADGHMRFTFVGMPYRQEGNRTLYLFRVQDKLILDILQQTRFERPVYFSITVGQDAYAGLDRHLRLEGMVYRVCPVPQPPQSMDPTVMEACLFNVDNTDAYHTEPHYGFKFRNLNNPRAYYDEVHRRLITNYRALYLQYARYALEELRDRPKALAALNVLNENISPTQFPMSYPLAYNVALLYQQAGDTARAKEFARLAISGAQLFVENPELSQRDPLASQYNPLWLMAEAYQLLGEYDQARLSLARLQSDYPNDPSIRARMDELTVAALEAQGKLREALDTAERLLSRYQADSQLQPMSGPLRTRVEELRRKLNDTAARAPTQ
jgi:tetratricopeptide (TPR) repeat protein